MAHGVESRFAKSLRLLGSGVKIALCMISILLKTILWPKDCKISA